MILAQFEVEVTRNEKAQAAQIIVYDTNEALNEAATNYRDETGYGEHKPARAITHSFQIVKVGSNDSDKHERLTNIVRIDSKAGAAVVSHELLHVACHMYRCWFGSIILGDECEDAEETLVYIHSDLVYRTATELVKRRIW